MSLLLAMGSGGFPVCAGKRGGRSAGAGLCHVWARAGAAWRFFALAGLPTPPVSPDLKATVDLLPRLWQAILRRDVNQDERRLALSIAPSPTAFRSGMVTASNIHTSPTEAARSETLATCSKNAPIRRTAPLQHRQTVGSTRYVRFR